MKSMEKDIRNALAALGRETGKPPGNTDCPGEETLVLLAEGNLGPAERATLHGHLDACSRCREILALDASPGTPGEAEAAPSLVLRARALLGPVPQTDLFDLVLIRVRDGLKVAHSGLRLLSPHGNRLAPSPVRTEGGAPGSPDSVRAEKALKRYAAEVEVTPGDIDSWNIRVFLMDAEKIAEETGLRVSLTDLSRRRELHSIMARKGTAVFQGVRAGDFGLEIRQRGSMLGTVSLRLVPDEPPA